MKFFFFSCCVDEVASEHVNGDSIIHFGHACLSPVIEIPVFYIFPKENLNLDLFCRCLEDFKCDHQEIIIFYDDSYHHLYEKMKSKISSYEILLKIKNFYNLTFSLSLSQGTLKHKPNVFISKLNLSTTSCDANNDDNRIICGRIFKCQSNETTSAIFLGNECVTLENLVLSLPGEFNFQ